jgi:hypothetical protein
MHAASPAVELETRLADLLQTAGVPYRTYLSDTDRLLDALDPPPVAAVGIRPALRSGRGRA